MRIKWYGTASLLIEGGNTRILVDPYLKAYNPALPRVPVEECARADAAVITHPHLDHFRDIGVFLDAGLKKVYVSQNGIDHAAANKIPADRMRAYSAGDSFMIGDIAVTAYQSRHCKFDLATVLGIVFSPRTYFHAKTAVSILRETKRYRIKDDICALEFLHGDKKIVVLGSAGMDKKTKYPQGADLFVFPYQGRSRMHRYMEGFLDSFAPKAVMIDHFDDAFPPLTHAVRTDKFEPAVKKRLPQTKAIVPTEGFWYEV